PCCLWFCYLGCICFFCFFFQAEDGIRDATVTGVQTCALPISDFGAASCLVERLPMEPAHAEPLYQAGRSAEIWPYMPVWPKTLEIGRAACRERVEIEVVERRGKENTTTQSARRAPTQCT